MIGDFLRLAIGGTALRSWTAGLGLKLLTGLFFLVAAIFGTIAGFAALEPELGTAWTAALIGAVFLAFGLIALLSNAVARRRRLARQLALAQTAALVAPALRPELLLLAAAAGAIFTLGSGKR